MPGGDPLGKSSCGREERGTGLPCLLVAQVLAPLPVALPGLWQLWMSPLPTSGCILSATRPGPTMPHLALPTNRVEAQRVPGRPPWPVLPASLAGAALSGSPVSSAAAPPPGDCSPSCGPRWPLPCYGLSPWPWLKAALVGPVLDSVF